MARSTKNSFSNLLAEQERFATIVLKADEITRLNTLFQQHVGAAEYASHCHVANYKDDCLVVMADSAAWATRLRYDIPVIIKKMRDAGLKNLYTIQCRIKPNSDIQQQKKTNYHLSSHAAKTLKQTAANIQDKKLRQALLDLADNADE